MDKNATRSKQIAPPRDPLTVPGNLVIKNAKDGERSIYLSDMQGKLVDVKLLDRIERFIYDWQPDNVFYVGDILEFWDMSDFEKDPKISMTIDDEIDACNEMLDRHKGLAPNCKQYFIEGNHEDRQRREMWNRPKPVSERLSKSLPEALFAQSRNMPYIKYRYHINYNGFVITHGEVTTENDAKKNLLDYLSSGVSGHTNRPKEWMMMGQKAEEPHTWYVLGMLCRLDIGAFIPSWRKNRAWQQGFGISEVHNKKVHFQLVRVFGGGFWAAGKYYAIKA